MERKEALKLLIELVNAQGIHTGRWCDEYDRDDSSREYLAKMMEIASELDIPFTINLDDYREYESDLKYELKDRAGYELYCMSENKIVELLLY